MSQTAQRYVSSTLGWPELPHAEEDWTPGDLSGLGWPDEDLDVSRETSPTATPPSPAGIRQPRSQRGHLSPGHRLGRAPRAERQADPATEMRHHRGGESEAPSADVSRETSTPSPLADDLNDTPIAREAQRAVRVMNIGGVENFPRPPVTRVLTIANQKGGVGKTTSTVNLAVALALHGARVLVIDLDPQGNASTGLDVDHHSGTPSIYEVLLGGQDMMSVAVPVDVDGVPPGRLMCVPATIDLAGAEIELVTVPSREYQLRGAIEAYLAERATGPGEERLDYVFIDCPPSLGLLTVNALVAAQEVLIPIQCEYYALEGLGQLLNNIELVRAHLNNGVTISNILLTMYDARTKLAEQVAQEVRGHFGDTVLPTVIPRSVRVSEAPSYRQSVITYDPGSRGALCYVDAARELAERGAPGSAGGAQGTQQGSDGGRP